MFEALVFTREVLEGGTRGTHLKSRLRHKQVFELKDPIFEDQVFEALVYERQVFEREVFKDLVFKGGI